jgi:CheY-like chemotaxis protein/anti-sigma regulatory factor (Ser/Thr protein kinase)
VSGSENEFFEIVINLVKNAAEALPKGGIISVTTIAREDRVILQVRDEGVGIPEEMLPRIFEPLWTTKGLQGTGMGLARARNIVERHKGTITVESQEGKGTTFTVTLPRTEPQMKQTETPTSEELGPPLNVLVADDSEPLVRMLREALTASGHRVFSALSGKKAIEMYNAARIDLVVCDSEMPEMNGWQVCRAIKDSCKGKKIPKPPVLLLVGFNRQGTEPDKLAEYGVDAILEKPVEISSLLKAVRGLSGKTVASSDPAELAKQH